MTNAARIATAVVAAVLCISSQPVLGQERGKARSRPAGDASSPSAPKAVPRAPASPTMPSDPAPVPEGAPATATRREASQPPQPHEPATTHQPPAAAVEASRPERQVGTPAPDGSRPRESRPPTRIAVPRGSVPTPPIVVTEIVHWGNPWGAPAYYGSYGPGSFYWDPYWGTMFQPWYNSGYVPAGALRIKVKPRDAQVFIDGYYEGNVDDFDGIFQRLHLTPGPHSVSVRAPGYESLDFQVQIRLADTVTYRGELRPVP